MKKKAIIYASQGPAKKITKNKAVSVLSDKKVKEEDSLALCLFHEQLSQMRETVNRLNFMMLEINSVLKTMPSRPIRPSILKTKR